MKWGKKGYGKLTGCCYGKSPFLMCKSAISIAIFNSYVSLPTRGYGKHRLSSWIISVHQQRTYGFDRERWGDNPKTFQKPLDVIREKKANQEFSEFHQEHQGEQLGFHRTETVFLGPDWGSYTAASRPMAAPISSHLLYDSTKRTNPRLSL